MRNSVDSMGAIPIIALHFHPLRTMVVTTCMEMPSVACPTMENLSIDTCDTWCAQ